MSFWSLKFSSHHVFLARTQYQETGSMQLGPILLFLVLQREYESEVVYLLINVGRHLLVILSQQCNY